MTGGWTCPIYYQVVVSLENGSVIIRYKLPELIKKFLSLIERAILAFSAYYKKVSSFAIDDHTSGVVGS